MLKLLKRIVSRKVLLAVLVLTVYGLNASWLAAPPGGKPVLLAHRGLAQIFHREGLTNQTCTASRMKPGPHDYLENTLASIAAAFTHGADIVELDVHPTTDGHFAVFHDWDLECRTNGKGKTRDHTLAALQALDVGHGYTADGGSTYPFRGKGLGAMPSLQQVLEAFPEQSLLINLKGGSLREGVLLIEKIAALPAEQRAKLMAYGAPRSVRSVVDRFPDMRTMSKQRLKQCLIRYALLGWSGYIPSSCENTLITVPANYAPWLWGYPNRLMQRLEAANSAFFLLGDNHGETYSVGFDDPDQLRELPDPYGGGIWTDRIDLIGPIVNSKRSDAQH